MKINHILLILLLYCCQSENHLQTETPIHINQHVSNYIDLQISSRVDTTQKNIREVLELYENYINSRPDSIYNNPFWNTKEKEKHEDFDFSRKTMFNGITSEQLFRVYKPFVLSIEAKKLKYEIRVLYSNNASEPPYVGSKIWCIHKLHAINEKGRWKLENLIVEKSRNWNNTQKEYIEFIYPSNHKFDDITADKSLQFCNNILSKYNPSYENSIKYYITDNVDDMGELENFDYYFVGITAGKSRGNMIFTSKGIEFYPHEFIHQLLPKNEHRGYVIEEGLATFLGTKYNIYEYKTLMQKLAHDYKVEDSYTLENILNNQTTWKGYSSAYPGGALICEIIFQKRAEAGLSELILGKTKGYEEILSLTENILHLNREDVIKLIEEKIQEFKLL